MSSKEAKKKRERKRIKTKAKIQAEGLYVRHGGSVLQESFSGFM